MAFIGKWEWTIGGLYREVGMDDWGSVKGSGNIDSNKRGRLEWEYFIQ